MEGSQYDGQGPDPTGEHVVISCGLGTCLKALRSGLQLSNLELVARPDQTQGVSRGIETIDAS